MFETLEVGRKIRQKHGMRDVQGGDAIAKVTVSGIGLRSHTHVATLLFKQLAAAKINVEHAEFDIGFGLGKHQDNFDFSGIARCTQVEILVVG